MKNHSLSKLKDELIYMKVKKSCLFEEIIIIIFIVGPLSSGAGIVDWYLLSNDVFTLI